MPFVLKQLNNFDTDNESPLPLYFAGTIRIGSGKDCDLIISTKKVLPFHCEIYHRGTEFRFVAAQSAFVEVNDSDILKWPAILTDGDILTIGITKYQFNIVQPTPRRSRRASFASGFAVILLISLIIFEIAVIVWLPYTLNKQKAWEVATIRQSVVRQIDTLRGRTRGRKTDQPDEKSIKNLLLTCENSIAYYLKKHINSITFEQARTVQKTLGKLEDIVEQWEENKKKYTFKESINPDAYINNLCSYLEKQTKPHRAIIINDKSKQ